LKDKKIETKVTTNPSVFIDLQDIKEKCAANQQVMFFDDVPCGVFFSLSRVM
jgi:hypothetical protein